MQQTRAFTVIELLVVVTIIVVLMALLSPALDKALYQAQLAVCGARHKAIGLGVFGYAMNNRRWYPVRAPAPQDSWRTYLLVMPVSQGRWQPYDFRTTLRAALDINKLLNDPLTTAIDMDQTLPTQWTYTPYSLWFGFAYVGQPGMFRIGDRWGGDSDHPNMRSAILVGDLDETNYGAYVVGGHPDAADYMHEEVVQNDIQNVYTRWIADTGFSRGAVDLNFLYSDGSVVRYPSPRAYPDAPLTRVMSYRSIDPTWRQIVPTE